MHVLKKLTGKIIYGFAFLISKVLDVLIGLVEIIVTFVNDIKRIFVGLIGMGGCLLLLFFGPFTIALLMNPVTLLVIMFFIIFPILGTKFVSYIKYLKYMVSEFLFDLANYLVHGQGRQYTSFSEYGDRYRRDEDARRRREQEERRSKQQKEWEERFRMWYEYQNSQKRNNGQGSYDWHGQNSNYGHQHPPYADPRIEFKKKYKESCDLLGIGYDSDKYQVKLAYRKKAKEYHPDINKSPEATKMFQRLNNAYEFLSDEHIQRYRTMT